MFLCLEYAHPFSSVEKIMDSMITQHIAVSQDIAGEKPWIAGHRITVQDIVIHGAASRMFPIPEGPNLARLGETWYLHRMTQLAHMLDKKLASWRPEVAAQVEQIITDVIELADTDTLDLQPSRAVVQEVLDTLDERQAG